MHASLGDILVEAQCWIEAGRGVAIATVVETWGSAPRPVGSHLVIDFGGRFPWLRLRRLRRGRGCHAGSGDDRDGPWPNARIRRRRRDRLQGGALLRRPDQDRRASARSRHPRGSQCRARRATACAIVTGIGSGAQRLVRAADLAADPLAKQLDERLRRRESGVEETEGGAFFLTVYAPPLRLIAIGAVHIAQALAPIATLAGYEAIIIDPRTAFATAERFPGARLDRRMAGDRIGGAWPRRRRRDRVAHA